MIRPSSCAPRSRRWFTRCSKPIALVVLVVILFLQTWRASIIPLLAVPVSIIGTFGVMYVFGFSINALSAVRSGACDRHRGRRRHRRGRECRAQYRGGAVAARGDLSRHERGVRSDHRDCAGAVRGVRAARLHQRTDRAILQAIRADDRDLDRDLGDQLAHAVAGPVGAAAEGSRRAEGPADPLHGLCLRMAVPRLQLRLQPRIGRLFRRHSPRPVAQGGHDGHLSRPGRRDLLDVPRGPGRLRAGSGQAISRRLRAIAGWRNARPHRRRHSPDERHRAQDAGRRTCGRISGIVDQRLHQQLQCRHRVCGAEAVREAPQSRS